MKTALLMAIVLFSMVAYADQCNDHLAYATSGTVTVSTAKGKSAQNGAVAYSLFNPFRCTSAGIAYPIRTVDPLDSNYYGFALVGVSGNATPGRVYGTTGAVGGRAFTAAGVNGVQSLPWVGGPIILPVGMYMLLLGTTCTSSCAALYGDAKQGHFYSFIYPNTDANVPWSFNSGGFSGISSGSVPQVSMQLDCDAVQSIAGGIATVIVRGGSLGHVYAGGVISVQGVSVPGASALNCAGCMVTGVNTTTRAVSYLVPGGSTFSGAINDGATLAVSPVMVLQAGFVAPTALVY